MDPRLPFHLMNYTKVGWQGFSPSAASPRNPFSHQKRPLFARELQSAQPLPIENRPRHVRGRLSTPPSCWSSASRSLAMVPKGGLDRLSLRDHAIGHGGTGFPTTPSRSRCLTVTGARAFFPIQLNPVQYTYSPPERLRLHIRVGLRRQPDIRVGAAPFAIMQSTGKGTVH